MTRTSLGGIAVLSMFSLGLSLVFLLATAGCGPRPAGNTGSAAGAPQAPQAPQAPAAAPKDEPMERVVAGVGVGQKGRRLDQDHVVDAIAAPAKKLFDIKEKAAFEFQVAPAMNYFKALEGRAPKSHEEFMEKIIEANNIQLPELPPGQKYVYDPATEQLMVERPESAENRGVK